MFINSSVSLHTRALSVNNLSTGIYYMDAKQLLDVLQADVVLTSFSTVQDLQRGRGGGSCGVLRKVHWLRIVVDEIQFVRNDTSQIARAMHSLTSTHIWMLSGTPFTKKIDEMQGVLSLLRLWPFALSKGADQKGGWTNWFWVQEVGIANNSKKMNNV